MNIITIGNLMRGEVSVLAMNPNEFLEYCKKHDKLGKLQDALEYKIDDWDIQNSYSGVINMKNHGKMDFSQYRNLDAVIDLGGISIDNITALELNRIVIYVSVE